jgi:hypothetical protein
MDYGICVASPVIHQLASQRSPVRANRDSHPHVRILQSGTDNPLRTSPGQPQNTLTLAIQDGAIAERHASLNTARARPVRPQVACRTGLAAAGPAAGRSPSGPVCELAAAAVGATGVVAAEAVQRVEAARPGHSRTKLGRPHRSTPTAGLRQLHGPWLAVSLRVRANRLRHVTAGDPSAAGSVPGTTTDSSTAGRTARKHSGSERSWEPADPGNVRWKPPCPAGSVKYAPRRGAAATGADPPCLPFCSPQRGLRLAALMPLRRQVHPVLLRTLLRDPGQQGTDLCFPVPTVATQRPD